MLPDDPLEKHLQECQEKFPLRPAEAEMIGEEALKKCNLPVPQKTADQGVKDMQARIDMLKGDKAETLDAMDDAAGHHLEQLTKNLNEINREIAEAEVRLTEYKAQQGLN
jgi:hypothetical protein